MVRMVYVEPSDRVTSCVNVYGRRGLGIKVAWRTCTASLLGDSHGLLRCGGVEAMMRDGARARGRSGSFPIVV